MLQNKRDEVKIISISSLTIIIALIGFALNVGCGPLADSNQTAASARDADFDTLAQDFVQPSGQARMRVCYAIPRGGWDVDALIQDLQQMKDAGCGGAWYLDGYEGHGSLFGDISYFSEKEAEAFVSDEHLRKLNRFLEEAHKRDLQIITPIRAMYMSGGPWIDQDHAAKEYTLSKTYVTGPGRQRIELPKPSCRDAFAVESARRREYYRDAFVIAWPVKKDPLDTTMHRQRPVITVNQPESHRERGFLKDGNPLSAMHRYGLYLLPHAPRPDKLPIETVITYEFPAPIDVATCFLRLAPDKSTALFPGTLSCSHDGKAYQKLADFRVGIGSETRIPLKPVKARWFQVSFPPLTNREAIGIEEIEFLAPGEEPVTKERVENFNQKAARGCWDQSLATDRSDYFGSSVFYEPYGGPGSDLVIRKEDVRDLTSLMEDDGTLAWEVPKGNWCVMRLGYTLAKHSYVNARLGGAGYECDIYSQEAARIQYEHVPGRILQGLSPEGREGLQGFWFESFEMGPTNWTPRLAKEFRQYAGYEITPWLPVLADEVVVSTEETDAFLADFRRALHYLFAKNHHGVIQESCEQDGLEWISETAFSRQAHLDDLAYLSRTHIPGGEFWGGMPIIGYNSRVTQFMGSRAIQGEGPWWALNAWTKLPASASHIYGHSPLVAVEALTGNDFDGHRVPAFDKHVSDRAFCTGANQFYVSWWFHDKRKGVFPGLHNWGWINPRNPIFRQSAAFVQYVSRCQSLLQRGLFQADVLVAQESAHHLVVRAADQDWPKVYVPKGYDFDFLSRELLLQDLEVRDGELTLSSGMRYRVLQIPEFANRMTIEGLRKIEQLLQKGAVIVSPKPVAGMSVLDYEDGLSEHRELADRIWSGLDGEKVTGKKYGQGRLYWGASLEEVLEKEGVRPDFSYESLNDLAYVDHIHRRITEENIDFYFLANAVNEAAEIRARFRGQQDKVPYLFDPLSGEIRRIFRYVPTADSVEIPLLLEPVGSLFVVFREETDPVRIVSVVETSAPEKPVLPLVFSKESEQDQLRVEVHANGSYRIETAAGRTTELTIDTVPETVEVQGPWEVEFRDMFGESFNREFRRLDSFHRMEDEQVRYFSGEAAYQNRFELSEGAVEGQRLYLDCGEVRWLAEVHINQRKVGVVWSPPWRLEITDYCRVGENTLEIICANPWKNRLIGDARLPEEERKTVLTSFRMKISDLRDAELMEAGLLGPIKIVPTLSSGLPF